MAGPQNQRDLINLNSYYMVQITMNFQSSKTEMSDLSNQAMKHIYKALVPLNGDIP